MHSPKVMAGILLLLLAAAGCSESKHVAGQTIYASRCAFCHGEGGRGDGPAGVTMKPPPPDMTSPAFWQRRTPQTLRTVILRGVPGTAMPGYQGTLDDEQLDALIGYLEGFRTGAATGASR